MWWGYENSALCEWVTCEAVEGSGRAGVRSIFSLFQMYSIYGIYVTVRFVCVHDCNGCAGQCGEVYAGRMHMTEVCGGRARSPEASILAGLSSA